MPAATATELFSQLTPAIWIHLVAAISALVIGPVALTVRKGSTLHRSAGYVWLTLMLVAAGSAVFIRDHNLPNIAGYTPIHLLVLLTVYWVVKGLRAAMKGQIQVHRQAMRSLYISACVVAGLFTLLPQRTLGQLLWHHTLGWV